MRWLLCWLLKETSALGLVDKIQGEKFSQSEMKSQLKVMRVSHDPLRWLVLGASG